MNEKEEGIEGRKYVLLTLEFECERENTIYIANSTTRISRHNSQTIK